MYGQVNYTSQARHVGPYAPPPPPLQQGQQAPGLQVIQQGPPCVPVNPGHLSYAHAHSVSGHHSLWTRSVHQAPPTGPPSAPSVFHPPPSQGPPPHCGPVHQPSFQCAQPLPSYSSGSGFSAPHPFGSFMHPIPPHGDRPAVGLLSPLPPPHMSPTSSPICPPLPSSSLPTHHNISKNDEESNLKVDVMNGSNGIPELNLPPPRPMDDKIVKNVEVMCQFIAKNGPEFEEMIRQKELSNPEYVFLFGGESGSEAAIAYEYFSWMKQKYQLSYKPHEVGDHSNSSMMQTGHHASVSHSPAESDMDMEDDISQPDEAPLNSSFDHLNQEPVPVSNNIDARDQLQVSQLCKDALDGDLLPSRPFLLDEQSSGSKVSSGKDPSISGKLSSGVDKNFKSRKDNECPLNLEAKKPSLQHDEFNHLKDPVASETVSEKLSCQPLEGANSFTLLQNYNLDDSFDADDVKCLQDVSHSSQKGESTAYATHGGCNPAMEHVAECIPGSKSGFSVASGSSAPLGNNATEADAPSTITGNAQKFADTRQRNEESVEDTKGHDTDAGLESGNLKKAYIKTTSNVNVDEFGRLVREGVSDSDSSDSRCHARRYVKKRRSRSRSHSPHERRRRRSPWRRRERRGQSRSLSPKGRRKSRSPLLKRAGEFDGEKVRREKAQLPECFDFLRGKCYRGASCRYSHHDTEKRERSRYSTRRRLSPPSRSPDFHEGTERISAKRPINFHRVIESHKLLPPKRPAEEKGNHVKELRVDTNSQFPDKRSHLESSIHSTADAKAGERQDDTTCNEPLSDGNKLEHCTSKVLQISDQQHQAMNDSLSLQATITTPCQLSVDKPIARLDPLCELKFDASPMRKHHPSQLLPSFLSVSQGLSNPFLEPINRDHDLIAPTPQFHLKSVQSYSTHRAPFSYHSPFLVPSNSSELLCPPPAQPNMPVINDSKLNPSTGENGIAPHNFQQSRPYPTDLPAYSQIHQCHSVLPSQESDQGLCHEENFRMRTLPARNVVGQPSGDPYVVGDHFVGHPGEGLHSLAQGLPSENIHQSDSYFQPLPYGPQYPSADAALAHLSDPGEMVSPMSKFKPHTNPYASTFDHLLTSKFSFSIPVQEKCIHSLISRNRHSPPNPVQAAEGVLNRSRDNQYDPLYDSIEPSSNSFKSTDHFKHERTDESDVMLGASGSSKPLDVEENNKSKGHGTVVVTSMLENDEFGETADAEVGAVETRSPSNLNDGVDAGREEIEIDQVKVSGKKKGKDSRSMKLFKVALANFVKEVLKPSWRQGNMSKEAFKTIVKKTVDKVSGALKSHHIPKSQAKINRYINSARGKLTKLVMGYVDKYVKV